MPLAVVVWEHVTAGVVVFLGLYGATNKVLTL